MYCPRCGRLINDAANFCCFCATPLVRPVTEPAEEPIFLEDSIAPEEAVITEEVTAPEEIPVHPRKKGRLWPALVVLLVVFAIGISAFALLRPQTDKVTDSAMPWFALQDGVLYFNAARYTGGSELTVPQTINGQTVTAIGDGCFSYCADLIAIHLPETITHIGESAFYGCTSLRGIRLPESLISLGDYAFGGCVSLEAVCIPYSLSQFGENLFYNCHKLIHFFYPAPVSDWYTLPIGQIRSDAYVYCADGIHPAQ